MPDPRFRLSLAAALLGLALGLPAPPARAALCDAAAEAAARAARVPLSVMRAITRVETARARDPWPWTVNVEGQGHWFETRAEAETFVARAMAGGARSIDIGCFQINHRWHGAAFGSISEMFDPQRNAAYAARFLRALHDESGDWSVAAGWFHSRTPERARRYRARVERLRAALAEPAPAGAGRSMPGPERSAPRAAPAARRPAPNRFPPLTGGAGPATRGSLVPLGHAAPAPLLPALAAARGS